MRILLTAFEPFDGTGLNSSLEACRRLLELADPDLDLRFGVLPVEYGADTAAVEALVAQHGPIDALVHTGQATRAVSVRIERRAVNERYAAAERNGLPDKTAGAHPIDPDGPAELFSTLPVDSLAEAFIRAGVLADVSDHAGIYLCNHVLYRSLQRAEQSRGPARVGFVHVPCLPEQAADGRPSLPAADVARGLRAALRALSGISKP